MRATFCGMPGQVAGPGKPVPAYPAGPRVILVDFHVVFQFGRPLEDFATVVAGPPIQGAYSPSFVELEVVPAVECMQAYTAGPNPKAPLDRFLKVKLLLS